MLQAWGVLEQRAGNLSAARRLFRSSLNINSQSYVTWMTWASLEEDQGNPIRAEEIRNLYFQQVSFALILAWLYLLIPIHGFKNSELCYYNQLVVIYLNKYTLLDFNSNASEMCVLFFKYCRVNFQILKLLRAVE